jgi:hypothetical protein
MRLGGTYFRPENMFDERSCHIGVPPLSKGAPNCETEIRRTADLLRFFANRIQAGEETQSVVGDMRQQEKRITAVCPDQASWIKVKNPKRRQPRE